MPCHNRRNDQRQPKHMVYRHDQDIDVVLAIAADRQRIQRIIDKIVLTQTNSFLLTGRSRRKDDRARRFALRRRL